MKRKKRKRKESTPADQLLASLGSSAPAVTAQATEAASKPKVRRLNLGS